MNGTLRNSIAAALLAVVVIVISSGTFAIAAEADNVLRYGDDDAANISRLPQVVAEREGFFTREGVDFEFVVLASSFRGAAPGALPMTDREAMENGTINMARQQMPLLINDALTGRVGETFVGVGITVANPVYFLVVPPEVDSYDDLRGKTIAITGLHDGITVWTRELLAIHGIGPDDVMLKTIAGSRARYECLQSGECVGASMSQPAAADALSDGYKVIGRTNEVRPLLYQFDIVNPVWGASYRDLVVKYVRATKAAMDYIMNPANREEVVRIAMDYMSEPEERVRDMLSYIWDPQNRVFPERAAIDLDEVERSIALLGKFGVLEEPLPAAERFVDPSYSVAAEQ